MRPPFYTALGVVVSALLGGLAFAAYEACYNNPQKNGVLWRPWAPAPADTSYVWQSVGRAADNVTFVVMASSVNMHRHVAQRESWMRHAPRVFAFSDAATEHTMTLPELEGRTTWLDAQHRQLRGMQWLLHEPQTRWYVLVDDDTWVHVPMLLTYLSLLPHNASLISGYRHESGVFNGGAGIVLTQEAFRRIASALYTEECPVEQTNDNTVCHCAERLGGFAFVHSNLFSFYPSRVSALDDFIDKATVHPVKDPELMRRLTSAVYGPAEDSQG